MIRSDAMRPRRMLVLALSAGLALGGCATPNSPARLQTLRVTATTEQGVALEAVRCTLRNGSGDWAVTAPGSVPVVVEDAPLRLHCESADRQWAGDATVEARSNRGTHMLVGAGVGALVGAAAGDKQRDHDNRTGKGLLSGLNVVAGVLVGALLGTGAGAAAPAELAYAEAVRVPLKPVPKTDR